MELVPLPLGLGPVRWEHVFATQTIWQVKPKKLLSSLLESPQKDLCQTIFGLIAQVMAPVGLAMWSHRGEAIDSLTMEER